MGEEARALILSDFRLHPDSSGRYWRVSVFFVYFFSVVLNDKQIWMLYTHD